MNHLTMHSPIYENWPNDAQTNYNLVDGKKSVEFFMVEETLLEENEDMLEKLRYFEKVNSWV